MNTASDAGCRRTFLKSAIDTPIPFTSVRKANSHVTSGLSGLKNGNSRSPIRTPEGVSTGMRRSICLFAFLRNISADDMLSMRTV